MEHKKHQDKDFNIKVGNIITMLRSRMGMTQKDLGDKMGISFQQIQKYESGDSSITIARLTQICKIFEISPLAFFNETGKNYIHDKQMIEIINSIYKMPPQDRSFIQKIIQTLP